MAMTLSLPGSVLKRFAKCCLQSDLERLRRSAARRSAEHHVEAETKKDLKRLKLVEAFLDSGNRPEWMIMNSVRSFRRDLRPLVPLDGGRLPRPI